MPTLDLSHLNLDGVGDDDKDTTLIDPHSVFARLRRIIVAATGVEPDEVQRDVSFFDELAVDSLSIVDVAVRAEDEFGVELHRELMMTVRTVGDFEDIITRCIAPSDT